MIIPKTKIEKITSLEGSIPGSILTILLRATKNANAKRIPRVITSITLSNIIVAKTLDTEVFSLFA
jgi:hypothetical protein